MWQEGKRILMPVSRTLPGTTQSTGLSLQTRMTFVKLLITETLTVIVGLG